MQTAIKVLFDLTIYTLLKICTVSNLGQKKKKVEDSQTLFHLSKRPCIYMYDFFQWYNVSFF